jgi:ribosomal protein S18 acetylase RimI-like enzyme
MYHTVLFENLSFNQRSCLINFIKENFPNIPYNGFGLESKTIIILNYENEKIVGCVCLLNNRLLNKVLNKSNTNLEYYNFNYTKGLFLYNLCVNENYRNKKMGSELVNQTCILAKQLGIEYIHCHASTEVSRQLFIKQGFMEEKLIDETKNYLMSKFV